MEFLTLAGKHKLRQQRDLEYVKWNQPNLGFKLNTDGTYNQSTCVGGTKGTFRDTNGEWVLGYSGNILELIALTQGLRLAFQKNLQPIEVNIDYLDQDIATIINSTEHTNYWNIIHDCRALLHLLGNPPISHVYGESNQVADALAKEGASMYSINPVFILEVPPFVFKQDSKHTNVKLHLKD